MVHISKMSVSDPLLKKLKGFIVELRTDAGPITDEHRCLQAFSETLELIFRKGLKQTSSLFGLYRKDYWSWVEQLASENNASERVNPIFFMVIATVKACGKLNTVQGRGRFFLRLALQKKVVAVAVEQLSCNAKLLEAWYDPLTSILFDEILREILMSLLFEATEINFKLNSRNCTFLDETWTLPVYRMYELVPCTDLGINLHLIDGRALAVSVKPGSVAEEDGKVCPGDVLDELLGESLRGVRKGKIATLLKHNQGFPVYLGIVKCHKTDGGVFRPIAELMRKAGNDFDNFQRILERDEKRKQERHVPPHAMLPEDEYSGIPVHNAEDKAEYKVLYIGRLAIGQDGGVHMIEAAVDKVLKATGKGKIGSQEVLMELGETDVVVTNADTKKFQHKHSYTEISSCGRRIDCVEYFAYIAGETTCTLAKEFVIYVFKASSEIESKTILCTIAQGFDRTHWFV